MALSFIRSLRTKSLIGNSQSILYGSVYSVGHHGLVFDIQQRNLKVYWVISQLLWWSRKGTILIVWELAWTHKAFRVLRIRKAWESSLVYIHEINKESHYWAIFKYNSSSQQKKLDIITDACNMWKESQGKS